MAGLRTGRTVAIAKVIPNEFPSDRASLQVETRAAAGERVRTRGWKVNMRFAIVNAVAGPFVAGGYANSDTDSGCRL
jgi:hypothetical protein